MPRDWLTESGEFCFGKHAGEYVEDVARTDPEYLRWVVQEVERISDEDREVLATHLARRSGKGRRSR